MFLLLMFLRRFTLYNNEQLLEEEKLGFDDLSRAGVPTREDALNFQAQPSNEKPDYSQLVISNLQRWRYL